MNKLWLAAIIALAAFFTSCKKESINPILHSSFPDNNPSVSTVIDVIIDQDQKGYNIPHSFEGLSYETSLLAENPDYLNENNAVLVRLIKNLGPGILRIGGNSSDLIHWAPNGKGGDSSGRSIAPADIDRLAAFSKAIHWPVIYGLNLGNNNPAMAVAEAKYTKKLLKDNLFALQSGNEPDVFCYGPRPRSYKYEDYQREWDSYYNSVQAAAPGVKFAGPDMTPFNDRWMQHFNKNESGKVRMLDGHFYNTGPASDPSIKISDILTPNPKMEGYLQMMATESARHNLPYRMSECNSIWGQGKPGVSNTFASTLWALDFMWDVAKNHGQGINFHGGGKRFVYSPIMMDKGVVSARPEYYSMLAFKYATNGSSVLPTLVINRHQNNNFSIYSCANSDGTYSVTIINKEVSKGFNFDIQLSKTASSINISRLTAPSIDATEGIAFNGSTVAGDGSFILGSPEKRSVSQNTVSVSVPAASVAILQIR